ncbi:MAG: hypothetical protein Q3M30_13850 [Candidatus Electrothrix sp. Rat3]|nr:hypothetical protein [Candidatus Electrothrix rattekaaiensis]
MDYRLELIDEDTFENLINTICQKILGIGIIYFAPGKDGGKDGRFTGTAQNWPDNVNPWSGKFIIQAKHTVNPIASCSDADFQRTIKKIEIPKIKKLREKRDVDCYLLFTNRKYTGVKGDELVPIIKKATGVENVAILGVDTINNGYLNSHKDIVKQYKLNEFSIPFDFADDEIKDIILAFKEQLPIIENSLKKEVEQKKFNFNHLEKKLKNEKNKLGEDYYKEVILAKSLMEFGKIQQFLNDPKNTELKDYYFDITYELDSIIILKRGDFGPFEEILAFIYKFVCDGCQKLRGSKRHVWTFLHYMYFECSIGKKC